LSTTQHGFLATTRLHFLKKQGVHNMGNFNKLTKITANRAIILPARVAVDGRLPLEALGLLVTLAAIPEGAEVDLSEDGLCAMFPKAYSPAVQSAFAALLNAGYIVTDHDEYRLCLD
jgi:hypothetical protein